MIVQDLFKNIDVEKLANNLIETYEEEKENSQKYGYEKYLKLIKLTIDDFLSIIPTICNDYIIVYKTYDWFDEEDYEYLDTSIIHIEDISNNIEIAKSLTSNYNLELDRQNRIDTYGMDLVERNLLLGYNFCENCFDKYDKYDVLATVFYELTLFGYLNETSEENVEEEKNILEERIQDVKEHPERLIPFEKAMEDIFGKDWKKEYDDIKLPTREQLDICATKNRKEIYDEISWIIQSMKL